MLRMFLRMLFAVACVLAFVNDASALGHRPRGSLFGKRGASASACGSASAASVPASPTWAAQSVPVAPSGRSGGQYVASVSAGATECSAGSCSAPASNFGGRGLLRRR